jgi:enoyl-CoA hydratase
MPAGEMADSDVEPVLAERSDRVATLRLNRPQALNALDPATLHALASALDRIAQDDAVRAVVITGTGNRAFCAGADIAAMAAMGASEGHAYARLGHDVLGRIDDLDVPVVAAVNGAALGGGLELVLACDLAFAAERARLGLPEITLGLIPGFGGTQLIYLGSMVGAADGLRLGIVDRVVPDERLADEAAAFAAELAKRPPVALRQAKRATRAAVESGLHAGLGLEIEAFAATFASEDRVEGLRAFLDKRPAEWKGR